MRVKDFFKYSVYFVIPVLLGLLSMLGGDENDYIAKMIPMTIPALIALLSLSTVLSGMLLKETIKLKELSSVDVKPILRSMNRSLVIEIGIIASCFVVFSCRSLLLSQLECIQNLIKILSNAMTVFAFMYFVLVIYDNTISLNRLIQNNYK